MTDAVTWWRHSMVGIRMDGMTLLTDPLLRSRIGPLRCYSPPPPPDLAAGIDAVLISHLHRDHLDRPSLRRFGPATTIVVPVGGAGLVDGPARVVEVSAGDVFPCGDVRVRVVPAEHGSERDPARRLPRAAPVGYVVEGSRRVYFAGDTGLFDGLHDIGPGLDLALLPVGGWGLTLGEGHLNPSSAVEALRVLRPRRAVPIHWGTLRVPGLWRLRSELFTEPGRRFATNAAAAHDLGDVDVIPIAPGQPLVIGD